MASDTRERLIDAGLDLFYKHGFHAVGLDQILIKVGTTKTTFYKHFESKDDLALACVKKRDAGWRSNFEGLIRERGGDRAINQLREVFAVWGEWFSDLHFNGCLFIHACSEFPDVNDPCHQAARENVNALRDIVAGLAREAGLRDPEGFAEQYKLLMQGAIVIEVIDRENHAASTAAAIADVLIANHTPPDSQTKIVA